MKKTAVGLAHVLFLFFGWLQYLTVGRNNNKAHRSLVHFFCITGGGFNDWCSAFISSMHVPLKLDAKTGVLGDMSMGRGESALSQLNSKGYVVFERALSDEVCNELMHFALSTPAIVRPMDGEVKSIEPKLDLYQEGKSKAVRYDYSSEVLLANPSVQALLADRSILALAEMYLDARPRADVLSMWWHTNFHGRPDSEAAQYYHFDLDRLKWLKVFIYLTDVGPNDGPHSFIEGSHGRGGIPQHILNKGYVRLTDEEVLAEYGAAKEITFSAPKGTIIVEDTRGLHKGNAVSGNARLILQLQFSNSLFGGVYAKSRFPAERTPELEVRIRQVRDVYQAYL